MEKKYSLWFHQLQVKEYMKYELLKKYGSCKEIFELDIEKFLLQNVSSGLKEKLFNRHQTLKDLEKLLEQMYSKGIEVITIEEEAYPKLLKEVPDPPIALFVKGDKRILNRPQIAVVGARKCSEYGYYTAKKLSEDLTKLGFIVISGMAKGIDEAAHIGALETGSTIAVLGTGVDICYPTSNKKIYEKIPQKGCLVSEFFPGDQGLPYHFPKRNRIISGMSRGIIIIEAAEKSGSLITADLALEQNREVFAVPGNINSKLSQGTNGLIQKGCKLIMKAEDILEEFPEYVIRNLQYNKENESLLRQNTLDKVEIIVYDCLSWQPTSLETISIESKIEEKMVQHILLKLELQGFIQRLPANRYIRNKENN